MSNQNSTQPVSGKVRVGIVGAKFAADFHTDAYIRNDKVEVVAIADINPDSLKAYCGKWGAKDTYTDYKKMLQRDDLHLISCCVPNFLHQEVVKECAKAGKHVICE